MSPLQESRLKHDSAATQAAYGSRAQSYDSKQHHAGDFHSMLADHMSSLMEIKPGHKVLSLACGTGLDAFYAAKLASPGGKVVGIDFTSEMIEVANGKVPQFLEELDGSVKSLKIDFKVGDIADLISLKKTVGQEKDWNSIICCSALVLLSERLEALKGWRELLKEDGILVLDVLQSGTNLPGEIFEEIASDLNLSVAWERLWAKDPASIRSLVEGAGYSSIEISSFEYPSVIKVHDTKSPEEIDQLWDSWIKLPMVENLGKRLNEEQLREAKTMFESKWKDYGEMFGDENGKVEERIKVWIVKARK